MDSITSGGIRMEKLNDSNFHSWRQKIELVLGHREVDEMINRCLCPDEPSDGSEEVQKWLRKDKTVRMTIGLTLSDEMLKNVSHTSTALEMWEEICNVYQRHTLLNKLSARREFYTATMQSVLNGLPASYETIITALDAIGDDDDSFTLDKVRSRLLQEEKRRSFRISTQASAKSSALVQKDFDPRKGNN
eukprot:IDg726t1